VDLEVTLRDLYLGRTFAVVREKAEYKPSKGTRKCNCKTRMATRQIAPGMYQQYPTQSCEDCPAVKLVRAAETLQVEVEPGMRDGHEITFFEQGEPLLDGEPGDLKFRLRTAASGNADGVAFERRGDDLHVGATVTLTDALVGFERSLLHLDGKQVPLRAEGVTRPGDVAKLQGQGMPVNGHGKRFGNMYVTYSVQMPTQLTDAQKKTVRELFKDAF
jgi:DnaJ family protein B protein 11